MLLNHGSAHRTAETVIPFPCRCKATLTVAPAYRPTLFPSLQTVIPSAISSGDSSDYQTFDLRVFANMIRVVPKYQKVTQFFSIKEASQVQADNSIAVYLKTKGSR